MTWVGPFCFTGLAKAGRKRSVLPKHPSEPRGSMYSTREAPKSQKVLLLGHFGADVKHMGACMDSAWTLCELTSTWCLADWSSFNL